jgi:hypothetical protein
MQAVTLITIGFCLSRPKVNDLFGQEKRPTSVAVIKAIERKQKIVF